MSRKDLVIKSIVIVFVCTGMLIETVLSFEAWHFASVRNDIVAYGFSIFFALLIPYSASVTFTRLRFVSICDQKIALLQNEIEILNLYED